ncbi:hypothetical protein TrLO_g14763 [Triparma laevis f. longispina]|uniref:Ceramidase n=1 Tax=Triparma laevis f. longispina TaxID=1714387 RepID=A0A9W6ZPU8_9STRA|nr:hypothetical protein TrLO_g14763 [Triparma laevis f. longispina]
MLPFIIHLDRGNNGAELWRKSFWGEDFYPIDYKSGYCEQVYPKMFMKEPMNSMSNYAFVIAGYVVFSCCLYDAQKLFYRTNSNNVQRPVQWSERHGEDNNVDSTNALDVALMEPLQNLQQQQNDADPQLPLLISHPVYSIFISFSLTFAGFSSFTFHASLTDRSHKIDMSSIYFMLGSYCVYALCAIITSFLPRSYRGLRIMTTVVASGFTMWYAFRYQTDFVIAANKNDLNSTKLISLFIVVMVTLISTREVIVHRIISILGLPRLPRRKNVTYVLPVIAVLFAGSAFLLWNMDRKGWSCHPRSGILGHAAWHVFMATALLFMYMFLRAEGIEEQDDDITMTSEDTFDNQL